MCPRWGRGSRSSPPGDRTSVRTTQRYITPPTSRQHLSMTDRVGHMADHPSIEKFAATLTEKGGRGEIVVLPDSVHTAALAAEALGCEVGAIANSLLFDSDGSPVLILTSGAHRVDRSEAHTSELQSLMRITY